MNAPKITAHPHPLFEDPTQVPSDFEKRFQGAVLPQEATGPGDISEGGQFFGGGGRWPDRFPEVNYDPLITDRHRMRGAVGRLPELKFVLKCSPPRN